MTTLVFRYGLATPHDGADLVMDQMRLAHDYRRALIWIERGRRWAARLAMHESSASLREAEARAAGADAACEWLAAEIRVDRKATRSRSETVAMRAHLVLARARLKEAKQALYTERARYAAQCAECHKAKGEIIPCPHATPEAAELRTRLDVIDLIANELLKNARAHCRLASGTYLLVEAAARASNGAPLYEKDGITPHDPDMPPPRWDAHHAASASRPGHAPANHPAAVA
jgi:cytochrome c553